MRNSRATNRSSLPSGVSRHTSSLTRPLALSSPRTLLCVPSMVLRKCSTPRKLLPTRLPRHTKSTLGLFWGASGSSIANLSSPRLSLSTTYLTISSGVLAPAFSASSASLIGFSLKLG